MPLNTLLTTIQKQKLKVDKTLFRLAYDFAKEAHKGQKRKNGEPYINHPLRTAVTLAELGMDQDTIIAGLLHDVPEDTSKTLEDVKKNFGKNVGHLVEGITKLGIVKYRGINRYVENLRKMFVAMAEDIRVIIIKFADRLDNLRTLDTLPKGKQHRIALESLEIYAPIANRLSIGVLKGDIEDEAFKYLLPKDYQRVKKLVEEKQKKRHRVLDKIQKNIIQDLKDNKVEILFFHSRAKHLYSLYKKLLTHDNDIDRVYDLMALRFIVPSVADCYKALGIIHSRYKPLKGRIKDYIAQPKPNSYQSLHTTVFGEQGEIVELQVRTPEMHEQAEYGIAAHWHYDEQGAKVPSKKLQWVEELARWQEEVKDEKKYLDSLKIEVFQNRIFVFTPKGDVIDLPEGSTPIDFAYAIHTDIGNYATGSKINDQMASLHTQLKNGDVIFIIVDKKRKGPNRDWLEFVKTRSARSKIKAAQPKGNGWNFPFWRK